MRFFTRIFLLCFLIIYSKETSAQHLLGLQSSNYAGVYGLYTQPASVADNRLQVDLSLGGNSLNFLNNYIGFYSDTLLSPYFRKYGGNIGPSNREKYMHRYATGDKTYANVTSEIYGPFSFMAAITKKDGIAFTYRNRLNVSVDRVAQGLADAGYYEFKDSNYQNISILSPQTRITAALFNEFAFTYGRVVFDNGKHFVKVGATGKLMQGLTAANMHFYESQFNFTSDTTLNVENIDGLYGIGLPFNPDTLRYVPKDDLSNYITTKTRNYFKGSFPTGWGADFGVVYEWRPKITEYEYQDYQGKTFRKRDKNKYKLKVGLSVTDLGRVTFKSPATRFTGTATGIPFREVSGLTYFNDSLVAVDFSAKEKFNKFSLTLPTAVSAQIDYQIYKNIYVNVMPYIALNNYKDATKMSGLSNVSITPRWENRWAGVAIPFYMDNNKNMALGATLRLGPVIVGSSTIGNILVQRDMRGFDFHFGLHVPLSFKPNKDKDYDGIKDKRDSCMMVPGVKKLKGCPDKDSDGDSIMDSKDKCPDVAGVKDFEGCPAPAIADDKDKDGIEDAKDKCPEVAGVKKFEGCPPPVIDNDKDKDGILDAKDKCPEVAGLKEFNGCPDTDKDGIQDAKDKCPEVAGLKELEGCPDTDKDGLVDSEDRCPELAGKKEFSGCPDTDGDGLIDADDKCPSTFGPKEFAGCPDTDGDGLADSEDACPAIAGAKEFKGCPDTDKDGIADSDDKCPTIAGSRELLGCPDKDKDGITDAEDKCPDVAGEKMFVGCPDTDKDGIQDSEDTCPKVAGVKQFKGCPDTDKDGIEDSEDACPTEAGPKEFVGCPDTDKDGIPDLADKCPKDFGPESNNGCPEISADTDKDGILDRDDACPLVPGIQALKGCPKPVEQPKEVFNAFQNLEFETAKDIILPKSFYDLDRLADYLVKNPELKLSLVGHTDNQGTPESNLRLSQRRADAVRNYLVKKGVNPTRIKTAGYGQIMPVADNATPEGRQKNRRVEMTIE